MDNNKRIDKALLSKQRMLIYILSAFALILAVLYFFILPLLFKGELNEVPKYSKYGDVIDISVYDNASGRDITNELRSMLSGGAENKYDVKKSDKENVSYTFRKDNVTISAFPYVFPEVPLEKVGSITVNNQNGTFTVYENAGSFYIQGAESNLYNSSALSSLILNARYMISGGYVENNDDLAAFGLSDGNESARVTVVSKDGESNTVIIGDKTADGRFYVKHTNKKYVYLMDSGAEVFFGKATDFLNAAVVRALDSQKSNYIDTFTLRKSGQDFFSCVRIADEDRVGVYINQLHKMTYPEPAHVLNTTTLYDMFEMASSLSGNAVMEYGVSAKENKDELLELYGLLTPAAEVFFTYDSQNYSFSVGNVLENGDCYVYSPYQDTIVTAASDSLAFLDYQLIDLYQSNVFQYRIDLVSEIDITANDEAVTYVLEGTGSDLIVTEKTSGRVIDTASFRQLYISLLGVTIGGYSSVGGDDAKELRHELTYGVKLRSGEKMIFEFYSESPVNCYMIADGNGGFKTDRRYIDDIISKSNMLMNGIKIESDL